MSLRLKRSTEIQADAEPVSGASEGLDAQDSPRAVISPKRTKRSSSKRLTKAESISLKSSSEALTPPLSLGEAVASDGVVHNARRTVAHLSFHSSDLKHSGEVSPIFPAGSLSSGARSAADDLGTSTPSGKRRNIVQGSETSYASDGEYNKRAMSPKRAESMTLRSPRSKSKARASSTTLRTNRMPSNFDRPSSLSSAKRRTKKQTNLDPESPASVSIDQARFRFINSDARQVFTKSASFHVHSPWRDVPGTPLSSRDGFGRMRLSSVESPSDSSSFTDPFSVYGVRKRLMRTRSVPFIYSWEIGQLEVDLWLPTIGYVYDHLHRQWRRRKKKKKLGSNDTEEASSPNDSVLALPLSARSRYFCAVQLCYIYFSCGF
jgi:hypothetical protein